MLWVNIIHTEMQLSMILWSGWLQEFSMNFTLVDGQGNFGNIDGDNAAAMRYTEARMSEVSRLMLEGINDNAVDFRDTYDFGKRAVLLPSGFRI